MIVKDFRKALGGPFNFRDHAHRMPPGDNTEWHDVTESIPGKQWYEGQALKGTNLLNGMGTVVHEGTVYEGWFKDGQLDGYARCIREESVEEGEFADNQLNGFAVKTMVNDGGRFRFKYRYVGQFRNHMKHGFGLECLSNGQWYLGYNYQD